MITQNQELNAEESNFDIALLVKPLSLGGAIQQGIQQNHDQINRQFQKEIIEIDWKDQWSSFWLPQIDISFYHSSSDCSITENELSYRKPSSRNTGGQFSLNLGEYSIFNWGKDYLVI